MKKYKTGIVEEIKKFLKIKRLEKLLKENKIHFDEIDNENIDYVLNNKTTFAPSRNIPYPSIQNSHVKNEDIIDIVLDFYDSIDTDVGKKMREIYNTYQKEIFFEMGLQDGGISFPQARKLPNGKTGVCIINRDNTYMDYFNTAHEFMHLLTFELGKNNEKLNEVQARFIEILLADYLAENEIITPKDKKDHIDANNNVYGFAVRLDELRVFQEILKQNKGKITRKVYNELLYEHCHGDEEKLMRIIDELEQSIGIQGVNSLQNNLRFIHATVGSKRLYEIYNSTCEKASTCIRKLTFLKKYKEILFGNGAIYKYNYSDFFKEIERYTLPENNESYSKLHLPTEKEFTDREF